MRGLTTLRAVCRCAPPSLARTFAKSANRRVPIILKQEVTNLGVQGDLVRVKPGYMRNFLYPQKMAVYASGDVLEQFDAEVSEAAIEAAERRKARDRFRKRVAENGVVFKRHSNDGTRLHGSVTAEDVSGALLKQYAVDLPATAVEFAGSVPAAADEDAGASTTGLGEETDTSTEALPKIKSLGQHAATLTLEDPDETVVVRVVVNRR